MKRQQEIVNLTHKLQEASLERQVLEEESDRGVYTPAEESSEQLALPSMSQSARVVSEPLIIDPAIGNAHAKVSLCEQNRASEFVSPARAALANIPPGFFCLYRGGCHWGAADNNQSNLLWLCSSCSKSWAMIPDGAHPYPGLATCLPHKGGGVRLSALLKDTTSQ